MKTFINFLLFIIVFLAIGILSYVAFIRSGDFLKVSQDNYSLEIQKVKNSAIDGCFESAKTTVADAKTSRTEPQMYLYNLCLKDKGLVANN